MRRDRERLEDIFLSVKKKADQKAATNIYHILAALVYACPACRTQLPDPETFKKHFESKHPKTPTSSRIG
uniref:C2H2-type domain-containing protein n=1 Tax=Neovison vison TaxID=452646 RepID=A0A8C7AMA0_NEOVI